MENTSLPMIENPHPCPGLQLGPPAEHSH
jgi:hypothetical protein